MVAFGCIEFLVCQFHICNYQHCLFIILEPIKDIDIERAEKAMERASQMLEEVSTTDAENYMRAQAALRRSNLRLKAAEQHRKRGHRSRPPGMGSA